MKHSLWVGLLTFAGATASQAFYGNDFETGIAGPEWSLNGVINSVGVSTTVTGNRRFAGHFSNDVVNLSLEGLTVGQTYLVGFDLFIINSWDGNDGVYGMDRFEFGIGNDVFLNTSFSNTEEENHRQNFPDNLITGNDYAAGTGADEKDTLGFTYYGDSVYKFGGPNHAPFAFVAVSPFATLSWQARNLQGVGDESWGLDNVVVKAVPEPSTIAIVGLLALVARRRAR